jgi:hypothetical protein
MIIIIYIWIHHKLKIVLHWTLYMTRNLVLAKADLPFGFLFGVGVNSGGCFRWFGDVRVAIYLWFVNFAKNIPCAIIFDRRSENFL